MRGRAERPESIEVELLRFSAPAFNDLRAIRTAVFVQEQGVDPAHEFDAIDESALHFLARYRGEAAGTARLYGEGVGGRIGRVAVMAHCRGLGIGEALMVRALDEARRLGFREIFIHAQTQALPFYEHLGFLKEGDEYEEEGIPHFSMRQLL